MKRWLNINLKNTVTKFVISYSLVLLLPLVISMIGYQISFKIVEEGIKETSLTVINKGKDVVDNELLALNNIMMQISTNTKINELTEVRNRKKPGLYQGVNESIKLLSDLSINSTVSIIDQLYVYLRDTDYIITPETLYRADFYHSHMLNEKKDTFDEWKKGLFDEFHYSKYTINNSKIDYIQSMPFSHRTDPKGAVVVSIKKDKLMELFLGLNENEDNGSFMYIEDEEQNIIASLSKDDELIKHIDFAGNLSKEGFLKQNIEGKKMIVVYTTSDTNGWRYVLAMPEKQIMNPLITFKGSIILLFFIASIIGIVIAYYIAYRNWRPLHRMTQQLKEFITDDEDTGDTFVQLGGAVSSLITSNQALASEIEKQQPLIQLAFLQKLVKGEFTNNNEIQIISESAGIDISFEKVIIITFRIFAHNENNIIDRDSLQELDIARMVTKNTLNKYIEGKTYFYDIDHLTSVAIIGIDQLDDIKNKIEASLEKSIKETMMQHGITPFFGISNECSNLLNIWRFYEQSKTALDAIVETASANFMWYEDVKQADTKYYYPLDFEQRIIKHTKAGETDNIKELIDILYAENFNKRQLENNTVEKLYDEMISTIIKLTQPNIEVDIVERLNLFIDNINPNTIEEFFKEINLAYVQMTTSFTQNATSRHLKMITNIKEYIQGVYENPELGLTMVASQFNISEGYLSFFFKEQTGINFTEYVEQLRINRACELLKDNTLTISEIGERVGYNSVQSFRRAFKRIQGVSPSAMRKK